MVTWHAVTTWVLPAFFVLSAAGILFSACTGPAAKALDGLPGKGFWPILLIFAGDAALGPDRPTWERATKGAAVALLVVAYAVAQLRVRRSRRPEPDPAS